MKMMKLNTYYYCTCKLFLCEKYRNNPDHQRLPNWYNCKIDGDCTGLDVLLILLHC